MKENSIEEILSGGEGVTIEFKSSFNSDVIETLVAFANTKGGSVLVGISDDLKIAGITIGSETIQNWMNEIKTKTSPCIIPDVDSIAVGDKSIVIFSVQEFPVKPVAVKGKYFKRVANSNHALNTQEVVNMHLRTFNTSWDYHTNNQYSINDISLEKVENAISRINQAGGKIADDAVSFLKKADLVRGSLITNASFLLFKNEDSVMTTIELGRFQTEIIIKDSARTKADILSQTDQVMGFVLKHINKEVIITGEARNTQKWQYPLEAIRENVHPVRYS